VSAYEFDFFHLPQNNVCGWLQHQALQKELAKRTTNVGTIRHAARQLLDRSGASSQSTDESFVQARLIDLTTKWDRVCRLSVRKQDRLQDAKTQVLDE
jgi:dystonin